MWAYLYLCGRYCLRDFFHSNIPETTTKGDFFSPFHTLRIHRRLSSIFSAAVIQVFPTSIAITLYVLKKMVKIL